LKRILDKDVVEVQENILSSFVVLQQG